MLFFIEIDIEKIVEFKTKKNQVNYWNTIMDNSTKSEIFADFDTSINNFHMLNLVL